MTNEERRMCDEIHIHYENDTLEKELVLKAARWKDRQFKEYLEKKLMDIRKENSCGPYGVGYNLGEQRIINEIIDELFEED